MYVCTACTVVSLSTTGLNFVTPPLTWTAPFDTRLVSSRKDPRNSNNSMCQLAKLSGSIANSRLGVSQFTKFRAASCHCIASRPCFASCNCCHGPFIVRSAQTRPPFTGFTQLAHPIRCSRSTLTTVCSCALFFRDHVGSVCLYQVFSPSRDPS